MPGLSILMPVYNERATVERAIREVLDAELPVDFELVVVDDGSTDGTREVLAEGEAHRRRRLPRPVHARALPNHAPVSDRGRRASRNSQPTKTIAAIQPATNTAYGYRSPGAAGTFGQSVWSLTASGTCRMSPGTGA